MQKATVSGKPIVSRKAKSLLKIIFKDLQSLCLFCMAHSLLRKAQRHLAKWFSLHSMPRGHQFEESTSTSCLSSAMARIRGGHTDPSVSCEARPSASAPQDSSQVPQAPNVLSFEGGVPSSPPQRRYSSRRPPTSLLPEPSVHHIPPKRARTSGPGETSRHSQPKPQAPVDSPHPSSIAPEAIIKKLMATAPPIEGNSDYRARSFHFEL